MKSFLLLMILAAGMTAAAQEKKKETPEKPKTPSKDIVRITPVPFFLKGPMTPEKKAELMRYIQAYKARKQAQLAFVTPKGDQVYYQGNMPCIVPDKKKINYTMPVAGTHLLHLNTDKMNAAPPAPAFPPANGIHL